MKTHKTAARAVRQPSVAMAQPSLQKVTRSLDKRIKAPAPRGQTLAKQLADEIADAVFQAKTAMIARTEVMKYGDLNRCVHGVLKRRL